MARKRLRPTIESLTESVGRLGLSPDAVDLDRLLAHLDLPDYGAEVEDERVARALREMQAARAFAETGVPAIRKAIPNLRAVVTKDHRITWLIRTEIPLLDNGRLDLRLDMAPEPEAAEILARMAARNDPTHRLEALRDALARTALQATRALHKPVDRLRAQLLVDLREVGADAAAYIAHMDRSLRSRVFTYGPKLARGLNDTLTPVRRHAKAVAREGSRLRRLRDQVGFGAYIERFTAARRLNRTILFHMGPTNSGKTYAALQHLTAAETGAYLAPLRLLALENYETLRERGSAPA